MWYKGSFWYFNGEEEVVKFSHNGRKIIRIDAVYAYFTMYDAWGKMLTLSRDIMTELKLIGQLLQNGMNLKDSTGKVRAWLSVKLTPEGFWNSTVIIK